MTWPLLFAVTGLVAGLAAFILSMRRRDEEGRSFRSLSWPLAFLAAGLVAVAAAFVFDDLIEGDSAGRVHPPPPAVAAVKPVAPPAATASAAAAAAVPTFDIVRINPGGDAVIAGRAPPKAEVVILDGDHELGRVTADSRGEWVFVPAGQLPPGNRELHLKAVNPDGSTVEGQAPVVLVVPEPGPAGAGQTPLAVRMDAQGGVVMQGPVPGEGSGSITIASVSRIAEGLSAAGKAPPQAAVQIYLDNALLGRGQADAGGGWRIEGKTGVKTGNHVLRADQLGADGKVVARVEVPFGFMDDENPTAGRRIVVKAGSSLWRIARQTYGAGVDYTVIYQANRGHIRDPDLIFPGQVFTLPAK